MFALFGRLKADAQPEYGAVHRRVPLEPPRTRRTRVVLPERLVPPEDRPFDAGAVPAVPAEPQRRPGEVRAGAEAADVAAQDDEEALGQAEIHLAADDRIDPLRALVDGPRDLRLELELQVGVAAAGVRVEGDAAPVGA